MKDDFSYDRVPFHYIHCLNPNCSRSEDCLRHLTALHIPKEIPTITALSPASYPEDTKRCPYFRSIEKKTYAWGISVLFDDIPYKKALLLRSMVHTLYPKTTYYRILHQERPLSPAEQQDIARIFRQNGITTPPVFDNYTEEYDWDEHNNPKAGGSC